VADIFFDRKQPELALRILSNLAEMNLDNRHVLRILSYRLLQAKQPQDAIPFLTRVAELAPNEPQSWRDLGLAHSAAGASQEAITNLWKVVSQPWHGRFPGVEQIALNELNATAATSAKPVDTSFVDERLRKNLPVDLRVVLAWDADDTDIDLWVTDPNGEKVYYGHRLSYQGGRISNDFTGGYGPEEFLLKDAKPGKYKVEAQFYGHRQQVVAPATSLMMKLTTQFGRKNQKDESVVLRLSGQREQVFVGEFTVK
jgi:Ca-activated chloride channel family protein